MRAVIQRVSYASVSIGGSVHSKISHGLLVLLGIQEEDTHEDIEWLSRKIVSMRIFADDKSLMNKSLNEVGGELMIISQFTLFASTRKGNRPSFIKAASPAFAQKMYDTFISFISSLTDRPIKLGVFAADMKIDLCNDGPVTIIIDSKIKE